MFEQVLSASKNDQVTVLAESGGPILSSRIPPILRIDLCTCRSPAILEFQK